MNLLVLNKGFEFLAHNSECHHGSVASSVCLCHTGLDWYGDGGRLLGSVGQIIVYPEYCPMREVCF